MTYPDRTISLLHALTIATRPRDLARRSMPYLSRKQDDLSAIMPLVRHEVREKIHDI
jgi:hypothetical protein